MVIKYKLSITNLKKEEETLISCIINPCVPRSDPYFNQLHPQKLTSRVEKKGKEGKKIYNL